MKNLYFLLVSCFFLNTICSQEKLNVFDIARKGTLDQAKEILKANPKAFNVQNEDGFSPLILACYRGNNEVAKFLIENEIDINSTSGMGTALMAAVVKKNVEIVKLLLEKKANPNIADANGTTALIYSVQFQNIPILELLLKYKSDKLHKDKKEKTAFEYAILEGNQSIINLLKSD